MDNTPPPVYNRAELLTKLNFPEELHAQPRRAPAGRRCCCPDVARIRPSPCRPRRAACQDRRPPLLQPYYDSLIAYLLYIVMQPRRAGPYSIYYYHYMILHPRAIITALLYIIPAAAADRRRSAAPGPAQGTRRAPALEPAEGARPPRSGEPAPAPRQAPDHRRRPPQSVLKKYPKPTNNACNQSRTMLIYW